MVQSVGEPSLEAIQRAFASALIGSAAKPFAGMPGRGQRLYAESVTGNLVAVLRAGFPIVRQFAGHAFFDAIAVDYVHNQLPASPCLSRYGGEFPDYLARRRELSAWPAIQDIAKWEWVCKRLLVAADQAQRPDVSNETSTSDLAIVAAAATAPFQSHFDIGAIVDWHNNKTADRPNLERAATPMFWFLQRQGNRVYGRPLEPMGHSLLVAALADRLAAEIDRLAELAGPQTVSEHLAVLIGCGALIALSQG